MSGNPVAPDDAATDPSPRRPTRRRRWPKILGITALVLAVLAAAGGAAAYFVVQSKLSQIKVFAVPGAESEPVPDEPVNILLLGSDDRSGKGNKGYGLDSGRTTKRSDTTILLHIAADRSRALAVSIPRDLWVEQPSCTGTDAGTFMKFNNAFEKGGPACTHELVQQVTGVNVDHVVVVDFNGFKNLVDAMGGVEVCLERDVYDPEAKLELKAGTHVVNGEQALGFVRARKSLGDGSDIGRIQRQQSFLSAAIRKATSTQLLLNPARLYTMLDVATSSLEVSSGLDGIGPMKDLADSIRAVKPSDITFVTLPFVYRSDLANVDLDPVAAQPILNAIRNDTPYPPPVTVDADGRRLTVAPKDISVRVLESSGSATTADQVTRELESAGFQVSEVIETGGKAKDTTRVSYPPGEAEAARTLAHATDAVSVEDNQQWAITLEVGADWHGVKQDIVVRKARAGNDTAAPSSADKVVCAS